VLAAMRRIPYEVERLRAGHWQSTLGTGLRGRTLGISESETPPGRSRAA
jgi:D-3-phosphoglycerate dehydrogenase